MTSALLTEIDKLVIRSIPVDSSENHSDPTIEERTETLLREVWPLIFALRSNCPIPKTTSLTITQSPESTCEKALRQKHDEKTEKILAETLKGLSDSHTTLVRQELKPLLEQLEYQFIFHVKEALETSSNKQSEIELLYERALSSATLLKEVCLHWKQTNQYFTDHFLKSILNSVVANLKTSTDSNLLERYKFRLKFCLNYFFEETSPFPPDLLWHSLLPDSKRKLNDFIAPLLIMAPPTYEDKSIPPWEEAIMDHLLPLKKEILYIQKVLKEAIEPYNQAKAALQEILAHFEEKTPRNKSSIHFYRIFDKLLYKTLCNCSEKLYENVSDKDPITVSPSSVINEEIKAFLLLLQKEWYVFQKSTLLSVLKELHLEDLSMHADEIESHLIADLKYLPSFSSKMVSKKVTLGAIKKIRKETRKQLLEEYFFPIAYCMSQQFLFNKSNLSIPILLSFYSHLAKLLKQKENQKFSYKTLEHIFETAFELALTEKTSPLSLLPEKRREFMVDARRNKISLKSYTPTESKKNLYKTIDLARERYSLPFNPDTLSPSDLQCETGSIPFSKKELRYAAAWAQGKRSSMEDTHFATSILSCPLFSVMDGHGDDAVAIFLRATLAQNVKIWLGIAQREIALNKALNRYEKRQIISNAMKLCCIHLNCIVNNSLGSAARGCGSTMVMSLIYDETLFFVNTGDSRVIIASEEGPVIQGSKDANPADEEFQRKIKKFGGFVDVDGHGTHRVNGWLATARAFGDFHLNAVSAHPKIQCYDLKDLPKNGASFVILACDGVFDLLSSGRAGQVVLKAGNPEAAVKALIHEANARSGHDNMTALVYQIPKD